jgi:hypothetical protein
MEIWIAWPVMTSDNVPLLVLSGKPIVGDNRGHCHAEEHELKPLELLELVNNVNVTFSRMFGPILVYIDHRYSYFVATVEHTVSHLRVSVPVSVYIYTYNLNRHMLTLRHLYIEQNLLFMSLRDRIIRYIYIIRRSITTS